MRSRTSFDLIDSLQSTHRTSLAQRRFGRLPKPVPCLGLTSWRISCFGRHERSSSVCEKQTRSGTDGNQMLTALILICSLTSVPDIGACKEDNALEVLRSPETFASPVTCLMHGQAYLANTAMGRDLNAKEAVKVICVRSKAVTTPAADASSTNENREVSTRQ